MSEAGSDCVNGQGTLTNDLLVVVIDTHSEHGELREENLRGRGKGEGKGEREGEEREGGGRGKEGRREEKGRLNVKGTFTIHQRMHQ